MLRADCAHTHCLSPARDEQENEGNVLLGREQRNHDPLEPLGKGSQGVMDMCFRRTETALVVDFCACHE